MTLKRLTERSSQCWCGGSTHQHEADARKIEERLSKRPEKTRPKLEVIDDEPIRKPLFDNSEFAAFAKDDE